MKDIKITTCSYSIPNFTLTAQDIVKVACESPNPSSILIIVYSLLSVHLASCGQIEEAKAYLKAISSLQLAQKEAGDGGRERVIRE